MTPNPDPDEEADVRGANVGSRRRPAGAFNSTMMTTTMLTVCGFEDSTERAPPARPHVCMYVCRPPSLITRHRTALNRCRLARISLFPLSSRNFC